MKRNGNNFILSNDITIETGNHQGEELGKVLDKQDAEIEKLKSNIKWIYKYGGVGSGKGGGTGISSSWSIYAMLGGELIGGDTIILQQKGTYTLNVRINNPSGGTFRVTYEYYNSGYLQKKTATLNQDNVWTLEERISLDSNDTIRIEVLDENAEIKEVRSNYITQSYNIGYKLVEGSGIGYSESKTFVDHIRKNGLKILVNYSVIDQIDSFILRYTCFDSDTATELEINTSNELDGTIELPAFTFDCSMIQDDFIGKYSFKLEVVVLGKTTNYERVLTILPDSLYLQVEPIEGTIYNDIIENVDDVYQYYLGTVSFYITAYLGQINYGNYIECSAFIKSEDTEEWEQQLNAEKLTERVPTRITLKFSNIGWNIIKFIYRDSNSGQRDEKILYIYIKDFENNLNWYPDDLLDEGYNAYRNIFRIGFTNESNSGFSINGTSSKVVDYLSMSTASKQVVELIPEHISSISSNQKDCLICVGIQYNSTSNNDSPILDIIAGDNEGTKLTLYQNKVTYGPTTIGEIYIGTELDNFDKDEGKNYHLVSIYRRCVKEDPNSPQFELCVYIDGVLETAYANYVLPFPVYTKITLYPNNYFINTLELSYFPHSNNKYYLTDAGIVRYWYTYKRRIQRVNIDEKTINTLNTFEKSSSEDIGVSLLDGVGTRVVIKNSDVLNGIVKNSEAPVMLLTYDESSNQGSSFFDWSEIHYGDNAATGERTVGVKWSPGSKDPTVDSPELRQIQTDSAQFILSIQGSTTKMYAAKNYMLTLKWAGQSDDHTVPLFSPNFDPEDPSTFLPEQAFTLKADVIDSGHSNNTCMGSFINTVTKKFNGAVAGNDSQKYSGFVKNCLEGFPFLLFIEITKSNTEVLYYYLGIYNFNLGRNSYFNLGYSDASLLPDKEKMSFNNGFCLCTVLDRIYSRKPRFTCAEVSYNNSYYDFSSYHQSILFSQKNANDSAFMFDDIYTGEPEEADALHNIQSFVEKTARAGGYIFWQLQKEFGEYDDGYKVRNVVPDFRRQYRKRISDEIIYELDEESTQELAQNPVNLQDLLTYVNVGANLDPTQQYYTVDYQSLVEYYLICMAFGMIDSVEKNLTIKTWDGKKFYFAFYDMDTCLGIDNSAKNSTYYAFSDLWENIDDENSGYEVDENLGEVVYKMNKQTVISRDYFSNDLGIVGYDTPSSYAFAVAKYFHSITQSAYSELTSPQSLWARWRKTNGVLSNADNFIDNFYLNYMKNINELMFNYNYRQKYLRRNEEGTGFDTRDIDKFHGRRIEYIRDWLSGRFHIMDAYLNLSEANVSLQPTISPFEYFEPKPRSEDIDSNNKDIYVIRDIFSNGEQSISGDLSFVIQAPDFSPLIIKKGDLVYRYLLPDSNTKYKISLSNQGNNKIIFGGSALWTYLDSINSFISPSMYVSSSRLRNLVGTKGTVNTWQINMPALQTVSLTSPNYSGDLVFDATTTDNFPNLSDINISGSNLSLKVKKEKVHKVNLTRVGTTSNVAPLVEIIGCDELTDCILGATRLSELTVDPVWSQNIELEGNGIKKINLSCHADSPSTLTISDSALTELTVTNFSQITINNCPLLEKISVSGHNLTKLVVSNEWSAPKLSNVYIEDVTDLVNLSFSGCVDLETLRLAGNPSKIQTLDLYHTKVSEIIYSADGNPTGNGRLDLRSMTSLTTLNVRRCFNIKTIYVKNDPAAPVTVYLNCNDGDTSELRGIYGHIRVVTSWAFANLPHFQLVNKYSNSYRGCLLNEIGRRTPLQIVAGAPVGEPSSGSTDASIKTLHNNVTGKLNELLGRNKLTDKSSSGGWSWFWTSSSALNLTFGYTDDGVAKDDRAITGNLLAGICAGTPVDEFNIYFILSSFAVSAARCNSGNVDPQSLELSFWYRGGRRFKFTDSSSQHPNRYMFYGCSAITNLGGYTITTSAGNTKLLAPSHNSNGEVICDNGLFSPLVNLTSVGPFISAGNVYISRFLFRRADGKKYPISSFWSFTPTLISDEVDDKNYSGCNSIELGKRGDFTDFFKDIGSNIAGTTSNLSISNSFSLTHFNFNTLNFPSNVAITSLRNSFNPPNGYGIIDFSNIFFNKSRITHIVNSFKVSTANTDYQNSLNTEENSINSGGRVLFPIKNGMFNGFSKLAYLGADDNDGGGTTRIAVDESSKKNSSSLEFGFSGSGLLKYIDQQEFPYNVFEDLKNTLITCPGFMSGLTVYSEKLEYFGNKTTDIFNFPGGLFTNTTKLTNVAAFLKNCKIPYKLVGGGFANCTKLENISEIFYGTLDNENNLGSYLRGSIPTKLFYHGSSYTTSEKPYYGINNLPEGIEDINELNAGDYINLEHKVIIPVKNITNNRKIRYAYRVFRGCVDIDPYEFSIDSDFGKIDNTKELDYIDSNTKKLTNIDGEYLNENYTYWRYCASSKGWEDGETRPLDISLVYDGNRNNIDSEIKSKIICEEDPNQVEVIGNTTEITDFSNNGNKKMTNTINFFCPPDLFSYLSDDINTNIQYMFSYCGLISGYTVETFHKAMTGRICPYLFKTIPNISSISGMFLYCSGLSSVKFNIEGEAADSHTYLIPPKFFSYATEIYSLASAFQGVYFERNPNLDVFSYLSNKYLDIRGIFSWCGYVGTPMIKEIFLDNKFSLISGAFASVPITLNETTGANGGVAAGNPLGPNRKNVKFNNNFPAGVKTKSTTTYYVYYNHGTTNAQDSNVINVDATHHNYA